MKPFVEENCTISFQGKEYSAGGAYMVGGVAALYIVPNGKGLKAVTWDGKLISDSVQVTSEWTRYDKYGAPSRHRQVNVTVGGQVWTGRYGYDWGEFCRLRLKKGKAV